MSDITTQQFDREDFFPFVRPWSISILSLYVIYTAIVVPLFIWRSNFHPLKLRSKGYMFVMIFAQLLMVGILSLRIAIGRQIFPCVLYYIFAFFGVPMFMFPYIMQSFQLIMVTRLGKMKQEMVNFEIPDTSLTKSIFKKPTFFKNSTPLPSKRKSSTGGDVELENKEQNTQIEETEKKEETIVVDTEKKEPTVEKTQDNSKTVVLDHEKRSSITVDIEDKNSKKNIQKSLRKLRLFNLLKMYVSSSFQLTIFTIAMLFHGVLFCLFNSIFYEKIFLWNQGCVFEFSAGVVIVIVSVVYFVVLGIELAYILFFTKEEFKIRQEIFLNIIIWIFFGILFLLFGLIDEWNRVYEYYFSAAWPVVFACFFSNFVSTVIPIIRTFTWNFKKRKQKIAPENMPESRKLLLYMAIDHANKTDDPSAKDFNSVSHLQAVLESKVASPFLLEYCKREWSSENFLFLDQLGSFNKLTDRESQLKYGYLIYDTFISKSASLELNINQRLRMQVKQGLDDEKDKQETTLITQDIFGKVEASITNLMLDTWGRFISSDLYPKMRESIKKNEKFEA